MTQPNTLRERFKKTKFAKHGGSCFECCDYEDMYEDMLKFFHSEITTIKERLEGEKGMTDSPNKEYNDNNKVYNLGLDTALSILSEWEGKD